MSKTNSRIKRSYPVPAKPEYIMVDGKPYKAQTVQSLMMEIAENNLKEALNKKTRRTYG